MRKKKALVQARAGGGGELYQPHRGGRRSNHQIAEDFLKVIRVSIARSLGGLEIQETLHY